MKETNFIKVIIPIGEEMFIHGVGEGCWFIVDDETKAAHDADEEKSDRVYYGILDNDSLYYKGLYHGQKLPFQMRGDKRPVVLLEALEKFEVNTEFFS